MQRIDVFDMFVNGISYSWKHQLLQGILLILFGILIIAFPQLLVVMIASVFVLTGAIMISSSFAMRRFHRRYDHFRPDLFEIF